MSKLGPEARAILAGGRSGDEPTAEDRARVRRAVRRTLAAGGAVAAASAATSAAQGAGATKIGTLWAMSTGKVISVVALISAVAAGTAIQRWRHDPPADPRPLPANVAESRGAAAKGDRASPGGAGEAPPAGEAPREAGEAPRAGETPQAASETPRAAGETSRAASETPRAAGETPGAATAQAAAPSPRAEGPAAPPLAEPLHSTVKPRASSAVAVDAPPIEAAPPAADPLERETASLEEARSALRGGDPGRALDLLDKQSTAYREGQLREERAAARVLALCKLGRMDEARAAAAAFLRESPRSPLVDRVRAGCPAATR